MPSCAIWIWKRRDSAKSPRWRGVHARLLDAPAEEAEAAAAAVRSRLGAPAARSAPAPLQRCHRELPVHLRLEDGRLLEGVIDLAFLEQERWVVVDFKSDSAHAARYERQLQWYLYALSKITGREATRTFAARLTKLCVNHGFAVQS